MGKVGPQIGISGSPIGKVCSQVYDRVTDGYGGGHRITVGFRGQSWAKPKAPYEIRLNRMFQIKFS